MLLGAATLETDVSGLKSQVSALDARVSAGETKTRDNTKGIASAMAMPALSIPTGKKMAFGMDMSNYDGMQGLGASIAGSINKTWSVQGSVGGSLQGGHLGVRTVNTELVSDALDLFECFFAGGTKGFRPFPMQHYFEARGHGVAGEGDGVDGHWCRG